MSKTKIIALIVLIIFVFGMTAVGNAVAREREIIKLYSKSGTCPLKGGDK